MECGGLAAAFTESTLAMLRVRAKDVRLEGYHYGGKLNDFSSVFIHTVTTRVLRLFSASKASGIGENGLTATSTTTMLLDPSGLLIFMIL